MTSSTHSASPAHRFFGLIPCAGTGSRAGTQIPKQYQPIAGQPMVLHTLAAFAGVERLTATLLVLSPGDGFAELPNATFSIAHCGGSTRALSVLNGLNALRAQGAGADDWVLVHDAARCLVTPAQINALMDACQHDPVGGLLAHRLADTLKAEEGGGPGSDDRVAATIAREGKWLAQTPQMFRIGALIAALQAAGQAVTDEAGAMEAQSLRPLLVPGSAQNFKVTYPEDFALAEMVLLGRRAGSEGRNMGSNFRMGQGWDVHALVPGRKLIIGGVEIPYHLGLQGHSDADVLLHAITDALLGAAGLGDVGTHFPDTSADYAGADSWQLLQRAGGLVRASGWQIGNIDCTVIAQAPKLAPYKSAMCERIASALALVPAMVNVKAKTAEKMGPVGEGKSIEAQACSLLFR